MSAVPMGYQNAYAASLLLNRCITVLAFLICIVLCQVAIAPTATAETPTNAEVEAYFGKHIPPGTAIQNMQSKSFFDNSTGYGRISISGELIFVENRYRKTDDWWKGPEFLGIDIERTGKELGHILPEMVDIFFKFNVYEIAHYKDEAISFTADLGFKVTAVGYDFFVNQTYGFPNLQSISLAEIEPEGVVRGTEKYAAIVAMYVARSNEQNDQRLSIEKVTENYFSSEPLILLKVAKNGESITWRPIARLSSTNNFRWSNDTIYDSFEATVSIEWLSSTEWLDKERQSGDRSEMKLFGGFRIEQPTRGYVDLKELNGQFSNQDKLDLKIEENLTYYKKTPAFLTRGALLLKQSDLKYAKLENPAVDDATKNDKASSTSDTTKRDQSSANKKRNSAAWRTTKVSSTRGPKLTAGEYDCIEIEGINVPKGEFLKLFTRIDGKRYEAQSVLENAIVVEGPRKTFYVGYSERENSVEIRVRFWRKVDGRC